MSALKQQLRVGPALLALALAAGCGNDMTDLKNYVAEVKARKSSDLDPIPEIRPYEPFTYEPDERRQPFTPITQEQGTPVRSNSQIAPDYGRNREPLEEFPLDALRMAGTLKIAGTMYALVTAPDGIVHRVRVGNHMGQNFGQIIAIDETRIKLVEIVPDGLGGYMKRSASIAQSE